MRVFPFGKAALAIFILSILSLGWITAHPIKKSNATLSLWTFAKTHYDAYRKAVPEFEAAHPGVTVDVQLVHGNAVTQRLMAAFWADLDVPDLVETEISSVGIFFRGPLEDIGFLDLTELIERDGLKKKMVASRFAPYTTRGRIFGLPHDVHPALIAYRRDIFEREGVDVSRIRTWDDFVEVGRRLTIPNRRYMIELEDTGPDKLAMFMLQRGGGYFDSRGRCIIDNEIAVKTMVWYVSLVAGPNAIGNSLGGGQILTKAVEDGYLLCLVCPDWRSKFLEYDIPRVRGKMALMPLPVFADGGHRSSTWGGTMIGITKKSKHPELAWKLAKHLYLNEKDLASGFVNTNIIPPVKSAWELPAFSRKSAYWSNQAIGELYTRHADDVPPVYSSPFMQTARMKLGEALVDCVGYYNRNGNTGLEDYVRQRLRQSADEVRKLMQRGSFD